jgi:hypothetical protein
MLGVKVSLVQVQENGVNKNVMSTLTDRDGRYGFVAEPGSYKIEIAKSGYKVVASGNTGQVFEVKNYSEGLVHPTIVLALDKNATKQKAKTLAILNILEKWFVYLSFVLLTLGSIVSIDKTLNQFSLFNAGMTLVYIGFWIIGLRKVVRLSPWGTVVDKNDSKPLPLTLIRVFDKTGKRLIKTSITNEKGKFSTLVQKGKYQIVAAKSGYELDKPLEINADDKLNVVNKKIEMSKGSA